MQQMKDRKVTRAQVKQVLDNWILRGIRTRGDGSQSITYYAFVPAHGKLVRVAISIDDERVTTVMPDRTATNHWDRGTLDYFDRLQDLEMRDET